MSARLRAVALSAAAALLLAACGTDDGGDGTAGGGQDTPSSAAKAPAEDDASAKPKEDAGKPGEAGKPGKSGNPVEDAYKPVDVPEHLKFTAKTLDGKSFEGISLLGEPAVLWFWAPWCPNCNAEAPTISKTAKAYDGKVTFVGVAAQDSVDPMKKFVDKYGFSFTNLNDEKAAVWAKFGITYQPAYAFIGADGSVEVVKDKLSESELTAKLDALAG